MEQRTFTTKVVSYTPTSLYAPIAMRASLARNLIKTMDSSAQEPKALWTPDGVLWRYNRKSRIYEAVFIEDITKIVKRINVTRAAYLAFAEQQRVTVAGDTFEYRDGVVIKVNNL